MYHLELWTQEELQMADGAWSREIRNARSVLFLNVANVWWLPHFPVLYIPSLERSTRPTHISVNDFSNFLKWNTMQHQQGQQKSL